MKYSSPPSDSRPGERMRVLSVVSSSNQLYSGVGRNIFEIALRLRDRVQYEFVIDDANSRNKNLMLEFGQRWGFPVHVGPATPQDNTLDVGNANLPEFLAKRCWDLVECTVWANAATNALVLEHLPHDVPLVYTPHDQPGWSVPMPSDTEFKTLRTHERVVNRADLVLCVSPAERETVQQVAPGRLHCAYLPNGCDFSLYQPAAGPKRNQLLFVGDLAEPRKRFDRVVELMRHLLPAAPDLRLVVVGNPGSVNLESIDPNVRAAMVHTGYIDEQQLRALYQESLGLILLSDFEAFGIPILEALASATPAYITPLETTQSLFSSFQGARFCPVENPAAVAKIVLDDIANSQLHPQLAADRARLEHEFDWNGIAERKWTFLRSTWYLRRGFAGAA